MSTYLPPGIVPGGSFQIITETGPIRLRNGRVYLESARDEDMTLWLEPPAAGIDWRGEDDSTLRIVNMDTGQHSIFLVDEHGVRTLAAQFSGTLAETFHFVAWQGHWQILHIGPGGGGGVSGAVNSVFGRTGDVAAATGDYAFPQVSGVAGIGQIPDIPQSKVTNLTDSLTALVVSDTNLQNQITATQDTIPTKALAGSHVLYVDASRSDSYTPTGSVNCPFKQIMGAIAQIIANADNTSANRHTVMIAPGTYNELIDLSNPALRAIALQASGSSTRDDCGSVWVTGGIKAVGNANLTKLAVIGVNFSTTGTSITFNSSSLTATFSDLYISGLTISLTGGMTLDMAGVSCWDQGITCSNGSGLNAFHSEFTTGSICTLTNGGWIQIEQGTYWAHPTTVGSGGSFFNMRSGARCSTGVTLTIQSGGSADLVHGNVPGTITVQAGGSLNLTNMTVGTLSNSGTLAIKGILYTATHILSAVAPTVGSGQVGLGGTTAATANAGSGQAPPATVDGYLIINVAGVAKKIPYFAS